MSDILLLQVPKSCRLQLACQLERCRLRERQPTNVVSGAVLKEFLKRIKSHSTSACMSSPSRAATSSLPCRLRFEHSSSQLRVHSQFPSVIAMSSPAQQALDDNLSSATPLSKIGLLCKSLHLIHHANHVCRVHAPSYAACCFPYDLSCRLLLYNGASVVCSKTRVLTHFLPPWSTPVQVCTFKQHPGIG